MCETLVEHLLFITYFQNMIHIMCDMIIFFKKVITHVYIHISSFLDHIYKLKEKQFYDITPLKKTYFNSFSILNKVEVLITYLCLG